MSFLKHLEEEIELVVQTLKQRLDHEYNMLGSKNPKLQELVDKVEVARTPVAEPAPVAAPVEQPQAPAPDAAPVAQAPDTAPAPTQAQ
jgi:hypothetical protein